MNITLTTVQQTLYLKSYFRISVKQQGQLNQKAAIKEVVEILDRKPKVETLE